MGQTVVEKIAQAHMSSGPRGRPLRAGDFLTVKPRHLLTHDNTSPVIKKFKGIIKGIKAVKVFDPRQPVFALDHDIQNRTEENLKKYRAIEAFAAEHGIDFYPAGTGIGHQVMCENLYVVPGAFVVASDSHANMYGALGAVGTPVVRTDAAAIWATGEFWWQIPATLQVVLTGKLQAGVTGKDLIIALCGLYGEDKVLNTAVEFAGPGVASLSIDARLSIANMTTEWGALVGWFPVDDQTLAWVEKRRQVLGAKGEARASAEQMQEWRQAPPRPDADAVYAARLILDLSTVTPVVSGPDTVQKTSSLAELAAKHIKIHKAYLLSCVNSRLEDLKAAAAVIRGRKIAPGVQLYLAAASKEVQSAAEQDGAWQALVDAGATVLPPSCGPCIGLGQGLLAAGEVGISATNRNFKGRMGSKDAKCYLASPAVVAASAIAGEICGAGAAPTTAVEHSYEVLKPPPPQSEHVEILAGFPATLCGRLVYLPVDNLNTDGIYGKDYTYKDDVSPEEMARVVMENYDPQFSTLARAGDILVAGFNFGTGSSREQAATALKAKGLQLVIAGSFSQTYQRNAFNNGVPLVECPQLSRQLWAAHAAKGDKTVIPGPELEVDFRTGVVSWQGQAFHFVPLGSVPQALVVAGGVENQVMKKLGIRA
ncbi:MAG: homoaconitase [Deltaproteobacteria bacterium]|nr:homoaconitase [Deltaproteobacteria bacterium]